MIHQHFGDHVTSDTVTFQKTGILQKIITLLKIVCQLSDYVFAKMQSND